jgi:hypothetical protein
MPVPNENTTTPTADDVVEGALAAATASLVADGNTPTNEPAPDPVDPQPGDANPPPDSAPKAPEGDGATDPDDNAPATGTPKPDDKKTVEPTDPAADDPAVVPDPAGGMKRPSDEFGTLPETYKAETRERFEKMKDSYDALHTRTVEAEGLAQKWVDTIASTGADHEQFGAMLSYFSAVNSNTPEGLQRAYDMMMGEATALAKKLGKPAPGYSPIDEHADLKARVENEELSVEDAIELASARALRLLGQERVTMTQQQQRESLQLEQDTRTALAEITAFGEAQKRLDPTGFAAKTDAMTAAVNTVVAELPPSRWLPAIQKLYAAAPAPRPVPTTPQPRVPDSIRPGGNLGAGGAIAKEPGSAYEAARMALQRA